MKRTKSITLVIIGILLAGGGIVLLKTISEPQGTLQALPYLMVGLGCGLFGHGMGEILSQLSQNKHPELARQIEIEQQDERNQAIGNRAKAKAYDMMIFVFGALMLSFALMGIDLVAVLLLVCAYLFIVGYGIYYRMRYDREM